MHKKQRLNSPESPTQIRERPAIFKTERTAKTSADLVCEAEVSDRIERTFSSSQKQNKKVSNEVLNEWEKIEADILHLQGKLKKTVVKKR